VTPPSLDSPERFAEVDTADALADVEHAAEQWQRARGLTVPGLRIEAADAVVVTGMGGSGIAGDIAAAVAAEALPVPVVVHKGYGLPRWVGSRSVVVACSYSGETEETLDAFAEAGRRGARRAAVTRGGGLTEACAAEAIDCVALPESLTLPPRHALGYLAVPVLAALGLGDHIDEAIEVLGAVAEGCGRRVPSQRNPAKRLGEAAAAAGPVCAYGATGPAATAAYRLKCQLNENAKLPAFAAPLPEAHHNEIVGLTGADRLGSAPMVVVCRDHPGEHPRLALRAELTTELFGAQTGSAATIEARGRGALARLASLVCQADFASVYAALASGQDPTPIAAIDELKARMAAESPAPPAEARHAGGQQPGERPGGGR
jgi:glucose/mannose-6-phosphate isomerase